MKTKPQLISRLFQKTGEAPVTAGLAGSIEKLKETNKEIRISLSHDPVAFLARFSPDSHLKSRRISVRE